jgi:hypothetical protein
LLGIIAHWISQSGILQSTVLGLWRFTGRHTGENQAESFWAVAKEYKIEAKIGYFILANASNNNTAMKCISAKHRELNIEFDQVQRGIRCHGHIINLVVKAFLWWEEPEAFELEAESLRTQQDEEAELLLWRRRGPIGKLHNIIVWIGRSPQRRDKFNEKVKQLHPDSVATALIYGNDTRWGGDYHELVRALQHREALEEIVCTAIRYNLHGERDSLPTALKLDDLHPEDWTILTDIMQFLQPFRK